MKNRKWISLKEARLHSLTPLIIIAVAIASCDAGGREFRRAAEQIERDATRLFPPGADAAQFERWFQDKGGSTPYFSRLSTEPGCIAKSMEIRQQNYCIDMLVARYCVDKTEKIKSLELQSGGYC